MCSRSQAEQYVRAGRIEVDGAVVRNPQRPTDPAREVIRLDAVVVVAQARVYVMLNKPRGLVVSVADEQGRDTVYSLLAKAELPWMGPVGRLDKASEGLLLLSNDSAWAARITAPVSHVPKTYHVQVRGQPDEASLQRMREGIMDAGERLVVQSVRHLRGGERQAWLEIVLDQGRNRHIRRMLAVLGFSVTRLLRVAVGTLQLGTLGKGQWRHLQANEIRTLAEPGESNACTT